MENLKIIVAGSRGFNDYQLLKSKLDFFLKDKLPNVIIISGTAKGADTLGERYAKENNLECIRKPADWELHGRRAGYIRNEAMASIADACIVFWDGNSPGTKNMIEIAHDCGLHLLVIRY
jgi:hypothetical protein